MALSSTACLARARALPATRCVQVEQTLRRVGKLGPALDAIAVARGAGETTGVLPAVAAAETYAYRNKVTAGYCGTSC